MFFVEVIIFCILVTTSIYLFLENRSHRKDMANLAIVLDGNIKIYNSLYNLYTILQENQTKFNKNFESLTVVNKEFLDFKQQVSDAFVIITDHFASVGTGNSTLKDFKADKLKPN